MRLAGFYRYPVKILLEESIADIDIEDEDTKLQDGWIFWQLTRL
jgi:hypothetical protein